MALEGKVSNIPIDSGEPLRLELEAFLDSIRDRRKPLADGEVGYQSLKIVEACYESSRTGRRIEIDWKRRGDEMR